ncbi:hypothetical protein RHMOL_Rhmol11G0106400 [Rhododendron molle]|uniref:Uncharacterized protein n=1 Tax=Rhododendron molle TaxID=49168 RepID=A0ACC0LQU3_RHOML|nr:hypothetical protein RHMOL_Rhmol11G0106400 [Rhododendron molle]
MRGGVRGERRPNPNNPPHHQTAAGKPAVALLVEHLISAVLLARNHLHRRRGHGTQPQELRHHRINPTIHLRPEKSNRAQPFLQLLPGNFPTIFYNCSNLRYLDLSQNNFMGPIAFDVDGLSSSLRYIDVGANNFSGDIPPVIRRLPELRFLKL